MERQLLLSSQVNYKLLKRKFGELTQARENDRQFAQKESRMNLAQQRHFHVEIGDLRRFVRSLVEELAAERDYRAELFEDFKAKTLSEIHKMYRSELEAVVRNSEESRKQCEKLLEMNRKLGDECERLRIEAIEAEIMDGKELEVSLMNVRQEEMGIKLERSQNEIKRLEATVKQLEIRFSAQNKIVTELRYLLMEEEKKSASVIESLSAELEDKQNEINELRTHYRSLLSRMKSLISKQREERQNMLKDNESAHVKNANGYNSE
ncbi:hypothetical protein DdX_20518 [Ditylenchus destructor]|uniref:Uncharacterized protein n=1 Tax=Ditylenchus destructor TaxID=166010 RepID=A0AAD4MG51_9BILA|nr:hypothetical protein DdX_20518 [Ditylenchus destructor]